MRFHEVFMKHLNKIQLVLYAIKHKRRYQTLQECEPSTYKHTNNSLSLPYTLHVTSQGYTQPCNPTLLSR